jgi:uncharacterized BrkB/YihY/UPF0761 family membrane protein
MSSMSPPDPQLPKRPLTAGQIVVLLIGLVMLLPGGCALFFFVGGMWEMLTQGQSFHFDDPITQMILIVWVVSLAISAAGVALIVLVRRRVRAGGV